MTDGPPQPPSSEQPTGPAARDQPTREIPSLDPSATKAPAPESGAAEAPAPESGATEAPAPESGATEAPAPESETTYESDRPPGTPPELWPAPADRAASGQGESAPPELDKGPRVEAAPGSAQPSGGGGLDRDRLMSVARSLAEKPEFLLGAAFGGGVLLAIIIRRLGS